MTLPKVLFVTDMRPDAVHAGSAWLRDFHALLPADRLAISEVSEQADRPASLGDVARQWIPALPERGLEVLGRRLPVGRVVRPAVHFYVRRVAAPRLADRIAAFGREQRAELVFAPLTGPAMIAAGHRVARALDVPFVTLVWDPPEYYLRKAYGMHDRALRSYLGLFAAAMRGAVRCGVMSDEMRRAYEARFGTPGIVMAQGVPRRLWRAPQQRASTRGELVIGYAGSLYARTEWASLLAALDSVEWRIGGRDVTIRLLSGYFDGMHARGPVRIDYRGWHSFDSTIAELAGADVCYLPYWFDDSYRLATQLCFPTKMSTYLAAGTPVLYHGPKDSTPARFLARHPAGVSCHSLDGAEIIAALQRACDPEHRTERAAAARTALEQELGAHVFRERFARLLGVEPDALRPLE